jgi:hypothetical protein
MSSNVWVCSSDSRFFIRMLQRVSARGYLHFEGLYCLDLQDPAIKEDYNLDLQIISIQSFETSINICQSEPRKFREEINI